MRRRLGTSPQKMGWGFPKADQRTRIERECAKLRAELVNVKSTMSM